MGETNLLNDSWLWRALHTIILEFKDIHFATTIAEWMIYIAGAIVITDLFLNLPNLCSIHRPIRFLGHMNGYTKNPEQARKLFYDNFDAIDKLMQKTFWRYGSDMKRQWNEFKETLIDKTRCPIQNTRRPHEYFLVIVRDDRHLLFWANFAVGIGLLFTFIGLVAALTFATEGLGGASASVLQGNMLSVLNATAAKFITSIAGVLISLVFRLLASLFRHANESCVRRLCDLLEHGLLYSPPQSIAAKQLRELEEQTQQLKSFSTELALSMGERFDQAIKPMVGVLSQIHTTLESAQRAQTTAVREGVQRMVEASAGREFEGFAKTLSQVREGLDVIAEKLNEGGYEAGRRMEEAAEKLNAAGSRLEEHFESLSGAIARMSDQVSAQANEAATVLREHLDDAVASFSTLKESLQENTASFAAELQRSLHQAVGEATEEGAVAFRGAIEQAANDFREMSATLTNNLDQTATYFDQLVKELRELEQGVSSQSEAFSHAAERTTAAGQALNATVENLKAACESLQAVPSEILAVAEKFGENTEEATLALQNMATKLTEAATAIEQTAQASTDAWKSYRERFGEVDTSLERFVSALKEAVQENSKQISRFVEEYDSALAKSVHKFNNVLDSLQDIADQFEEIRMKDAKDVMA